MAGGRERDGPKFIIYSYLNVGWDPLGVRDTDFELDSLATKLLLAFST
jgi:hypothetical protein